VVANFQTFDVVANQLIVGELLGMVSLVLWYFESAKINFKKVVLCTLK